VDAIGVQIVIAVIGILLSYIVARKYGDVAAVRATRKYHEQDLRRARLGALQSLKNEVERIRKAAAHNADLQPNAPPHDIARLPANAFETAFVSGRPGLSVGSDLLAASMEYLARADSINSLVDIYLVALGGEASRIAGERKQAVEKVAQVCTDVLPDILDRLSALLQVELKKSDQQYYLPPSVKRGPAPVPGADASEAG
jgi:hypothetical protein